MEGPTSPAIRSDTATRKRRLERSTFSAFAMNKCFTSNFWLDPYDVYLILFTGLYIRHGPMLQGR